MSTKETPPPSLAEMVAYLQKHETYIERFQGRRFSWNIKVYNHDDTGWSNPDYTLQHKWDARWKEFVETDHYIFSQCCEDGLCHFFDEDVPTGQHYFAGVGDDHPLAGVKSCKFFQAGRSGGHLLLHKLDSHTVDPTIDWYEAAEEEPDWVRMVHAACIDVDQFNAEKEMSYQYGFRRHEKEEEWDEEAEQSKQEKKDLKLIGTFIYLRAHPVKHRAVIEAAKRLSLPTTPEVEEGNNGGG